MTLRDGNAALKALHEAAGKDIVYHGPTTETIHIGADGRTVKLCGAKDSELIVSFKPGRRVNDGDTITIPSFTITRE